MQTVDRAIGLLSIFSEREPELGLSDLARRADLDKATTRRLLMSLAKHGLIEQNRANRRYRLGPGLLRLAQVREATAPIQSIITPVLEGLAAATGEMAHFGLLAGNAVANIGVVESSHANRVTMETGEQLPLHATSTGLAILAFSEPAFVKTILALPRETYTENTPVADAAIHAILRTGRAQGCISSTGFYEADVCSVAAPVFDHAACPAGAVALAAPASRFDDDHRATMRAAVMAAAVEITQALGGHAPAAASTG